MTDQELEAAFKEAQRKWKAKENPSVGYAQQRYFFFAGSEFGAQAVREMHDEVYGGEGGDGMTRQEHLNWCKQRALEYVDAGDVQNAFASMASDLGKHPETAGHLGIQLGMAQMMGGMLSTPAEMRKFIEGFN